MLVSLFDSEVASKVPAVTKGGIMSRSSWLTLYDAFCRHFRGETYADIAGEVSVAHR